MWETGGHKVTIEDASSKTATVDISILIKTFVAVFVLADALGNIPIFLVLTKGMEPEQRHNVVDRASVVATVVLLVFAFAGQLVLA